MGWSQCRSRCLFFPRTPLPQPADLSLTSSSPCSLPLNTQGQVRLQESSSPRDRPLPTPPSSRRLNSNTSPCLGHPQWDSCLLLASGLATVNRSSWGPQVNLLTLLETRSHRCSATS